MTSLRATPLPHRGVLAVGGADRRGFLQGLISNDIEAVRPDRAAWAAMLTPQGKFLHEFFILERGDVLLLEGEAARLEDLKRRLGIYRLRAKVTLAIEDHLRVYAAIGDGAAQRLGLAAAAGAAAPFADGMACVDPRLPAMGARVLLPAGTSEGVLADAGFAAAALADYDRLRITLGLPDGSRDLPVEKAILLENGFDELGGVDWNKGCYVGQELTARTRYRGLIKKRLLPVRIEGPAPEAGTPLRLDDREAGEMRSAADEVGLALLRLEHLERARAEGLRAGAARLFPDVPEWVRLPKGRAG